MVDSSLSLLAMHDCCATGDWVGGAIDEGDALGLLLGLAEGKLDRELLGLAEGDALGPAEGDVDGEALGDAEGDALGLADGEADGDLLGLAEGDELGAWLGL